VQVSPTMRKEVTSHKKILCFSPREKGKGREDAPSVGGKTARALFPLEIQKTRRLLLFVFQGEIRLYMNESHLGSSTSLEKSNKGKKPPARKRSLALRRVAPHRGESWRPSRGGEGNLSRKETQIFNGREGKKKASSLLPEREANDICVKEEK